LTIVSGFLSPTFFCASAKAQASERQNIRHMENRSPLTFRFVGIQSAVSVRVNFLVRIVMVDDAKTFGLSA
jgi:hypothetical protein